MPLYEYECFLCGERFERIQKVSADPVTTCPSCGGSVRRLLGVPALQFKGSGWYVTDYGKGGGGRSGGDSDAAKAPSPTESKTDAGSEGSPPKKEKTSSSPSASE